MNTSGSRGAAQQQGRILTGLFATTISVDQASKSWAWRHVGRAWINGGGNLFAGKTIGTWYADPTIGAALDIADSIVLGGAACLLNRRLRSRGVLIGGGLLIAGWVSNVLDRLGLHRFTAPGSERGAVDFIPVYPKHLLYLPDQAVFNLADGAILIGALLLVLSAAGWLLVHRRPEVARPPMSAARGAARNRRYALALAGTTAIVACALLGAVDYRGAGAPGGSLPQAAAHRSAVDRRQSPAAFSTFASAVANPAAATRGNHVDSRV